jgi:hypothetical protein
MTRDTRSFNEKANAIRQALDTEVSSDDLEGLQGQLLRLSALIGLSAELKARAVADLKTAHLIAYSTHKSKDLPASIFKTVIEGEAAEAHGKLELADRLNAGLTHAMDGIRTIISFRKDEMKNSNFQV